MFTRSLLSQGQRNFFMQRPMMMFGTIAKGGRIPSGALASVVKHDASEGFQSEIVDVAEYLQGKKVCIVGYPGAFTPTCMATHVPDFIKKAEAIKAAGVDEILALAVNDPFVVTAFAEKLGGKGLVNYIADGNGELTRELGL